MVKLEELAAKAATVSMSSITFAILQENGIKTLAITLSCPGVELGTFERFKWLRNEAGEFLPEPDNKDQYVDYIKSTLFPNHSSLMITAAPAHLLDVDAGLPRRLRGTTDVMIIPKAAKKLPRTELAATVELKIGQVHFNQLFFSLSFFFPLSLQQLPNLDSVSYF
jgi:hypothetical protein